MKTSHISGIVLLAFAMQAFANPIDPTIMSGDVSFHSPNANEMHILANDNSVIHWKDFSIDLGEMTKFIQPSADSLCINRVVGDALTTILGRLESNSSIYLINQNGFLFGENAVIDKANFLASILDMPNPEELLFKGDSKAKIINYGTVNAWDGDVTFISYQIENHGSLNTPNGVVSLAAGREVLLQPHGSQLIFIRASGDEKSEDDRIINTGSIYALQAELKSSGNPYGYAIKQEGLVEATGTLEREGRIYLVAGEGMNISSGTMIAKGGTIHMFGEKVGLLDEALVDVSADYGGGTFLTLHSKGTGGIHVDASMVNGFAGCITFLCTGGGALEIRDEVKYVGDILLRTAASPIGGTILVSGIPAGAPATVVASSAGDVEVHGRELLYIEGGGNENAQIVTVAGSIDVTVERIVIDHGIVGAFSPGIVAGIGNGTTTGPIIITTTGTGLTPSGNISLPVQIPITIHASKQLEY